MGFQQSRNVLLCQVHRDEYWLKRRKALDELVQDMPFPLHFGVNMSFQVHEGCH